jgi:hypothetical protein
MFSINKILFLLLISLFGCAVNKETGNYDKCEEFTFLDSSSFFEYDILKFEKNQKKFFILSNKSPKDLSNLQLLEVGRCYALQLTKNDTLKTLKRIIKINVRSVYPTNTYWDDNDPKSIFLVNDSLVVDTYTSKNLIGFYYKKEK